MEKCDIEHIIPQQINADPYGDAWKHELGPEWRRVWERWLHTPGNLTLVGSDYNKMMANGPFSEKKDRLLKSIVYLNQYFRSPSVTAWNEDAVKRRGQVLAREAAKIWIGPPK